MWKTNSSLNDYKRKKKRLALSCSKKPSTFFRGVTSKYHGDFQCLNCIHSFRKENQLESHEKVGKNKDFCRIVMPSEKDNILEFNQYEIKYQIKYHILFMLT